MTEPTREGFGEPSLIDHVITNVTDLEPTVVEVLTEFTADHRTIVVRPPFQRQRCRPKPFKTGLWRKVNWDAICLDLVKADWTSLYEAANVDEKLDAFMSVWWSIADCHCPIVTIVHRRPYCPWLKGTIPPCSKLSFIPKLYVKRFSTFHWSCRSLFPNKILRSLQEINALSFN